MSDNFLIFVFVLAFTSETGHSANGSNSTRTFGKYGYSVYKPGWSLINDGALQLWFRTEMKDAMVIYEDVGGQGEFLDVFLVEGRIQMRMAIGDCSYEERIINGSFNDLKWHKLVITREQENTTLSVDGIATNPVKCSSQFEPMVALYAGFLSSDVRDPSQGTWAFPTAFWQSMEFGFQGCLKGIQYTEYGVVTRPKLRATKNTKPGCSRPCLKFKCRHGGRCIDRIFTAKCDCKGTGYEGKHCARVIRTPSTPTGYPTTISTETTKRSSDVLNPTKSKAKEAVIAKAHKKASGVIWKVTSTTILGLSVIACCIVY